MHFQGLKLGGFLSQLFITKPRFIWFEHISYLTSSAVWGAAADLPKPLEVVERNSRLLCRVHLRDLTWILVTLTQFHTSYFIHLVLVRGGHGKWVSRISNQWLTFQECPEADRLFRIMCSVHSGALCQGLQGPHSRSHRANRLKQASQLL